MLNSLKNEKSMKISILFINYWLLGKLKHFNLFNKSLSVRTDHLPVTFASCDKGRQEAIALFLRISLENKPIASETTALTNTVFHLPGLPAPPVKWQAITTYCKKGKRTNFLMTVLVKYIVTAVSTTTKLYSLSINWVGCNNLRHNI